jgi:PAS domain S-box-containing protein
MSPTARKIGNLFVWCLVLGQPLVWGALQRYFQRNSIVVKGLDDDAVLESFVRVSLENRVIADANGTMTWISPTLEGLLGYKPGELKGKPVSTLVPERYLARHARKSRAAIVRHDGKISTVQCFATKKDGTERPFEIRVRVTLIEDKEMMFVTLTPLEQLVES